MAENKDLDENMSVGGIPVHDSTNETPKTDEMPTLADFGDLLVDDTAEEEEDDVVAIANELGLGVADTSSATPVAPVTPVAPDTNEAPEKAVADESASTEENSDAAPINDLGEFTDVPLAPLKPVKKLKKDMTKKERRQYDKEMKSKYHVSNWDIIKNYRSYNEGEKKHYRYIFGRRVTACVWPIIRFLILFGLGFVIMYPILYMISTSLRPQVEMTDPSVMWIPKEVIFTNITDAWTYMDYPKVVGLTLLVNVVCSLLQVVTCSITGYGFARFNFKFKKLLFMIVILQIIVPVQIILIPQFMQFRYFDIFGLFTAITGGPLNLVDQPIALYLQAFFCNGIRAGLFILLFRQFFRGLPKELEDAAYLDGCGPFQTFLRIMVPNASSSFLTVFIFSIVWYWNDSYVSGMFFTNSKTISLAVENLYFTISSSMSSTGTVQGTASEYLVWIESGCLLSFLPILILYICLQKYFVEGVERSGIVG